MRLRIPAAIFFIMRIKNVNTMKEIWLPIKGYEDYYEVSNFGRIKSLNRVVGDRVRIELPERIMKMSKNEAGYWMVDLYKKSKRTTNRVHRLVAEAFIPNPKNKPQVNHKDSNRANSCVSNLEWCTPSENTQHGYDFGNLTGYWSGRLGYENKSSKPIIQRSISGDFIREFAGQMEAERSTGIFQANIGKVCRGERNHAGGFLWEFKNK
jgi:hypothetical protein